VRATDFGLMLDLLARIHRHARPAIQHPQRAEPTSEEVLRRSLDAAGLAVERRIRGTLPDEALAAPEVETRHGGVEAPHEAEPEAVAETEDAPGNEPDRENTATPSRAAFREKRAVRSTSLWRVRVR